jgi:uncharacterized membrane protein YeaQ/YmgE (transglycosylase-associated protein family)
MTIGTFISWAICGLVVGLIARAVVPGRQSLSLPMTSLLGIVGAFVGGFLYWIMKGQPGVAFSLAGNAWHGWILAVVGASLMLWLYPIIRPRKWWQ